MAAAKTSRDTGVISGTDADLLAVTLELGGILYTDDFAIQNVAGVLGCTLTRLSSARQSRSTGNTGVPAAERYDDHDGRMPGLRRSV